MKNKLVVMWVIPVLVCFWSCSNQKRQNPKIGFKELSGHIWISYRDISEDSIEVGIHYTSPFDTISSDLIDGRFVFLYLTRKNISGGKMKKLVKLDNKKELRENGIHELYLGNKKSFTFHYAFHSSEKNYIIALVKDRVFLKESSGDRKVRMVQKTYTIKEEIIRK